MRSTLSHKAVRTHARGSALVMVLLVVLILTIVGLSVSYFTNVEDRVSGNAKLEKAGFYAAESGLRIGEAAINSAVAAHTDMSSLLMKADPTAYPADAYLPPGGGSYAAPLVVGGTPYKEIQITMPTGAQVNQAYYTLYIRNNAEDPGGPLTDTDQKINLVAVGRIALPGGPGIVKVLEEQLVLEQKGSQTGTQKGGNAGGTGAGVQ
jgi:hypothetical protein